MTRFQYQAVDQHQQTVTGALDAESLEAARAELVEQGLTEIHLEALESSESDQTEKTKSSPMSVIFDDDHLEELGEAFASIAEAGLPLEAGLRLMAEEHPSPRISQTLLSLSEQLESGKTWDELSETAGQQMPPTFARLFQLRLPPDQFSGLLSRYLSVTQSAKQTAGKIWSGLLYSQLVLLAIIFATGFMLTQLVPKFKAIFIGFDTELPGMTMMVINMSDFAQKYGLFLLFPILVLVVWRMTGTRSIRKLTQQMTFQVPFSGKAFRENSFATFCLLLADLVERRVPLSAAVKLAASGSGNLVLEDESAIIAKKLDRGESLSSAAAPCLSIPKSLLMSFRWSTRPEEFTNSLRVTGNAYSAQASNGAGLLPVVLEPFLLFSTLFIVGFFVMALFMPLIKLLNDLS